MIMTIAKPLHELSIAEAGRALRAGGLTNPGAWRGRVGFTDWLRHRNEMPELVAV